MGKVVAICNFKGGVGKTATSFNLAAACWICGKKVLVVDCDNQSELTKRMNIHPNPANSEEMDIETLYGWLLHYKSFEVDQVPIYERYDRFHFIPSQPALTNLEIVLSETARRTSTVSCENYYVCLKRCLDTIKDQYDYIFLDCPPSLGFITCCALIAADELIIPVSCSSESIDGVLTVCAKVDEINTNYNKKINIRGCLLTMYYQKHIVSRNFINDIEQIVAKKDEDPQAAQRSKYSLKVIDSKIRPERNIKLCHAGLANIFEFAPCCNGAEDYMRLAQELYELTPPKLWKTIAPKYWGEFVAGELDDIQITEPESTLKSE